MRPVPLLLFIVLLSACTGPGTSLVEVRATQPLQSGSFPMPYDSLAACVKARIKTDPWTFGQPIVGSEWGLNRRIVRVHASYARSAFFEMTFQPISPGTTRVDYRRSYDGHGTQEHAWSIIEQCASPTPYHWILVQADNPPYRIPLKGGVVSGSASTN
jgi:hypothetical protein